MLNKKIFRAITLVVFLGFLATVFGLVEPLRAFTAEPDLILQSPILTANSFGFTVKNNGASTTSSGFDVSYRWIRSDNTFTGGQYLIHISGNLAYLGTFSYMMPAADVPDMLQSIPRDALSLRLMADANGVVGEMDETNNSTLIYRVYPDLTIEQSVLDANNFSFTVRNLGAPFRTASGYVQWFYQWLDASHHTLGGRTILEINLLTSPLNYNQTYIYTASPGVLQGLLVGSPAGAAFLYVQINPDLDPLDGNLDGNDVTLPKPLLPTPTPTLTPTPTPTAVPTPTPTPWPTPTLLPSYTPKPSLTLTPTPTPSEILFLQPKLSSTPLATPKATLRPAPSSTILPPQIPKTPSAPPPTPETSPSPSTETIGENQAALSAEFSIGESEARELRVPVKVRAGAKLNVRGWDLEKKEEIVSKPDAVRTVAELKTYAEALAVSDENIKKLGIAKGGVEIAYSHRGKMLGFIPWGYIVSSSVSKSGGVKVRFPWYSVFLKKDFTAAELTEEVETDLRKLETEVQARQMQDEITKLSRTFQLLSNIMKARHDTAQSAAQNLR